MQRRSGPLSGRQRGLSRSGTCLATTAALGLSGSFLRQRGKNSIPCRNSYQYMSNDGCLKAVVYALLGVQGPEKVGY